MLILFSVKSRPMCRNLHAGLIGQGVYWKRRIFSNLRERAVIIWFCPPSARHPPLRAPLPIFLALTLNFSGR